MQVVRKIGVGVAAAIVAGIVMGALARLMMRLATLAAGHDSGFTLGGTLGILATFVLFAVPGSLLAVFVHRRGRSALLVLGALALCLPAASIASSDLGDRIGLSVLQWVGVGLATAGVFATIAGIPVLALWTISTMTGARRAPIPAVAADPLGA